MQPRVVVLILCHNGCADTLACLRSLAALDYPRDRLELVVIDNASSDGTPASVRAAYPSATLIETGRNLGYAAGNNVGLRYALGHDYEYVLLLNNDTEVMPDVLQHLLQAAATDPSIGIVGPTIYYDRTPDIIWSAGGTIDWRRGTSAMRGLDQPERHQYAEIADVDFISGCALLCKRAVIERIGLIDERFFMYYEETEWCVRATRAGFCCLHVPHARIRHKIQPDHQARSARVTYYMARNRLLFLRSVGATPRAWFHALVLQDLRTWLSLSLRPRWAGQRAKRTALLHAWIDFCRGRFGPIQWG